MNKNYFYGTGRRKTAVARVRLYPGTGQITVNNKTIVEHFGARQLFEIIITQPLRATNNLGRYNVSVKVVGGGVSGQAGAVRHGIARALLQADDTLRPTLKKSGYLTRDPRMKERKKPGLKRARKAPQYTKR
ncbi:MAG: 30S ribosomal protein S9 [Chloroflexi bacterium]|uniref:Small ribosomal subunit protein uS9 n=1 Tax=Candidatus Chlorohelix allophototropha TaxID=3003348 RepID=A0A8T7M0K8_9CHLR|nr:30S ribosomal protein S9 [Chloroflexota bacterium]WJW67963.1 30S ribosomal protein S9 [Chloroflexota bacterium L227-S17]